MSLMKTQTPTVPGGRAAGCCPLLTYSIGCWGVYRRFKGNFLLWKGEGT